MASYLAGGGWEGWGHGGGMYGEILRPLHNLELEPTGDGGGTRGTVAMASRLIKQGLGKELVVGLGGDISLGGSVDQCLPHSVDDPQAEQTAQRLRRDRSETRTLSLPTRMPT